jgi:hypothetical protein
MKKAFLIGFALVVVSSSANAYQKISTVKTGGNSPLYVITVKCDSGAQRKTSSADAGFGITGYYATDNPYSTDQGHSYISAPNYKTFDASAKKVCNE